MWCFNQQSETKNIKNLQDPVLQQRPSSWVLSNSVAAESDRHKKTFWQCKETWSKSNIPKTSWTIQQKSLSLGNFMLPLQNLQTCTVRDDLSDRPTWCQPVTQVWGPGAHIGLLHHSTKRSPCRLPPLPFGDFLEDFGVRHLRKKCPPLWPSWGTAATVESEPEQKKQLFHYWEETCKTWIFNIKEKRKWT